MIEELPSACAKRETKPSMLDERTAHRREGEEREPAEERRLAAEAVAERPMASCPSPCREVGRDGVLHARRRGGESAFEHRQRRQVACRARATSAAIASQHQRERPTPPTCRLLIPSRTGMLERGNDLDEIGPVRHHSSMLL
jgi:hypothetical protein